MAHSIITLPLELLFSICSYLPASDYGKLRSSCKHVDESTFHNFACQFFTKRQFMLTEYSLKALLDISKSRFSPYLKDLTIATTRFDPAISGSLRRALDPAHRTRYLHESIDQDTLMSTAQDQVLLAEAFQHLNIEALRLKDFNPRASYGVKTVWDETGMGPGLYHAYGDCFFNTTCMNKLLAALGKGKARPKKLELHLTSGVLDSAFHIPHYMSNVFPVLAGIEELLLNLCSCVSPADASLVPVSGSRPRAEDTHLLRQFLARLPNLRNLRIDPRFREDIFGPDEFMTWLSSSSSSPYERGLFGAAPPPPVTFPYLENLYIGQCTISQEILVNLITKFMTSLRKLDLDYVILSDFSQTRDVPDTPANPNIWQTFLRKVAKSGARLESMSIARPEQCTRTGQRNVVFEGHSGISQEYYLVEGAETMEHLKELATHALVDEDDMVDDDIDGEDWEADELGAFLDDEDGFYEDDLLDHLLF